MIPPSLSSSSARIVRRFIIYAASKAHCTAYSPPPLRTPHHPHVAFDGEYTIFAGLEDVLRFVENFQFNEASISFLRGELPHCEPEFFAFLASMNGAGLQISAMREGSVAFPRVPCVRIEGPLAMCQIVETTVLALCNYASLMTTNAARYRVAVGPSKKLLEFGLRRAQGPDGALSASRYSYMGGFDGTSNVLASKLFGVPVGGTHAHSFVTAFASLDDVTVATIAGPASNPGPHDLLAIVQSLRAAYAPDSNEGELAAFTAYAVAFPNKFLALIDTYDTLHSGLPNFLCVAAALAQCGYAAVGIRLDSGDLAYLSKEVRRLYIAAKDERGLETSEFKVVASNNINEVVLHALAEQGHEIDVFGIGTHLVTCQRQPALGMVYKLVEVNGAPRIKLSQELSKVTIPGRKDVYRLISAEGIPLLDLMTIAGDPPPKLNERVLCRHPFDEKTRVYARPARVEPLLSLVWDGAQGGLQIAQPTLTELRDYVQASLARVRNDHLRATNPTPYKVSLSHNLYTFLHGALFSLLLIIFNLSYVLYSCMCFYRTVIPNSTLSSLYTAYTYYVN